MKRDTFIFGKLSFFLIGLSLWLVPGQIRAQDTISVSPTKDAMINYAAPTTNYGSHQYFVTKAIPGEINISLIEFSLSTIPSGSYVTSAKLTLQGTGGHLSSGNSNKSYLRKVTSSWEENAVTWNNKPSITTADQVELEESTSSDQDYEVDITVHVRDMLLNGGNYGFALSLVTGSPSARMEFASSDYSTSSARPKVEIIYETPDALVLKPVSYGVSCEDANMGAVDLEVQGGIGPYSYAWSDGDQGSWTTQNIGSLSSGDYSVTVTDALNAVKTTSVGVGVAVELVPNDHLSVISYDGAPSVFGGCNSSLYHEATKQGISSWGDGAVSENKLAASTGGWVEFTVDADDQQRMFGLTSEGSSDGNWTSMEFGFYMNASGDLIAIENGTQHSPVLGSYSEGDILRITRNSTGMVFEKNGTQIHSIASEVSYFDYTDVMAVDVNIYNAGATMNGLRASFDNPIRVVPELTSISGSTTTASITIDENEGCYSGYSYSLSDGTSTTYTSTTVSGVVTFSGLSAGDYELSITRTGYATARKFTFSPRDDDDFNWVLSKTYKKDGALVGTSKIYYDRGGRTLQSQVKDMADNNIIAGQSVYDERGRAVLKTLPAPLYLSDFNYRPQFLSDYVGNRYDHTKFDQPNTASGNLGEVDNPYKVNDATKGTVGWYYGDRNDEEKYVATTHFPYSRVEFDEINPGRVKRISSPHNQLKMGSGHEVESYTMLAAGELDHVYGYKNGWAGGNYETDATSGCDKVIFHDYEEEVKVFKTISIDPEGKERISFFTNDGWQVASAYSGLGDAGINLETYDVQNVIKSTGVKGERYADIHLPEGCEETIEIVLPSGATYDVLDLRTNTLVFDDVSSATPTLTPGLYRILINFPTITSTQAYLPKNTYVKYNLNYYDYSLAYHDLAGRVIATVPPKGVELYKPKWSYYEAEDASSFVLSTTNGVSDWGLGTVGTDDMGLTISAPNGTNPNHLKVLTFYLDKGTTIKADLVKENTAKSSESLVTDTDAKAISAGQANYHYESSVAFEAAAECGCATGEICLTASSLTAALDAVKGYCPNQYPNLEDKGNDEYCLSCADTPMEFDVQFEIVIDVIQTEGEDERVTESNTVIATKYSNGWQFRSKTPSEKGSTVPGGTSYGFKLNNGETAPSLKLQVQSIVATKPVLVNGSWDGSSIKLTKDFSGLEDVKLRYGFLTYYLNDEPEHSLYSLYDYNAKGELNSDVTPDEGKTEYLYDNDGQLRFSQNAKQKSNNWFDYYRYDRAGRLIENGEYRSSGSTEFYFQNYYNSPSPSSGTSVKDDAILQDYDYEFPALTVVSDPTHVLYDIPDPNFSYLSYCQRNTRGRISKTWTQDNYTTDPRIETWYSYLPDGRMEWMVQAVDGMAGSKKHITMHYENEPSQTQYNVIYQKDVTAEYMEQEYTYNLDGELTNLKSRTVTSGGWYQQAEYDYYQHGPLKREEIGGALQGIDYIYNTMGWLKAINSPNLGKDDCYLFEDPGADGHGSSTVATDVFGMTIDYFNYDYEKKHSNVNFGAYYAELGSDGAMNNWDGKIKSVRWALQDDLVVPSDDEYWMDNYDDHWMYTYAYNQKDWLKEASFGTYFEGCQNSRYPLCFPDHHPFQFLANTDEDYRVWNMDYDANGNIQHLNRKAKNASGSNRMDEFTYNYASSCSNQLEYIADGYSSSWTGDDLEGQSANNYAYNEIGEQETDALRDVRQVYDAYGLVTEVTKKTDTSFKYAKFTYDDKGMRLSKKVYKTNGTDVLATWWYINDPSGRNVAVYWVDETETSPSLELEEQTVSGLSQVATYYEGTDKYVYPISDHLGNVRAVLKRDKDVNGNAQIASNADYYPYGMVMPGRNNTGSQPYYPSGYQGEYTRKDKEDGTEWDAFELRMYDSRMARWMSRDPARQYNSPYMAMGNNPVSTVDEDGALGHWTSVAVFAAGGAAVGAGIGYLSTEKSKRKTKEGGDNALKGAIIGGIIGATYGLTLTEGNLFNDRVSRGTTVGGKGHGGTSVFDGFTPEIPKYENTIDFLEFTQKIGTEGIIEGLVTGAKVLDIEGKGDKDDRWRTSGSKKGKNYFPLFSLNDRSGTGISTPIRHLPDPFILNDHGTWFQRGTNYLRTKGEGSGSVTYRIKYKVRKKVY